MTCELIGGPNDGAVVDVDLGFIISDSELYMPDQTQEPIVIATHRWLFGDADHLDFAGYERVHHE